MALKARYDELILYIYLIGLISFIFLKCQEITAQEVAALSTLLIVPCIGKCLNSKGRYKGIVTVLLIYMLMEAIRSIYRYGQGISTVFYLSGELLSLVLYYYFTGFSDKKKEDYLAIILRVFKIALVMLWLIALLYNFTGIQILDETIYSRLRNGNVRLYNGASLIVIGLVILFSKIIDKGNCSKKIKFSECFFMILGAIYFIYVCQSRMLMVAVFLTLASMYLLSYKKISYKVLGVFIFFLLAGFIFLLPNVQNFFSRNFGGIIAGTDNATVPRLQAIKHFVDVVKNDKFLGMGFMSYSKPSNNLYDVQYILRGRWATFYTNDVGIVGYYMTFGIVGVLIYILLVIKMLRQGIQERYTNPHKLGLAIFLILSSISTTYFDQERQSFLILVLLCMELNISSLREKRIQFELGKRRENGESWNSNC